MSVVFLFIFYDPFLKFNVYFLKTIIHLFKLIPAPRPLFFLNNLLEITKEF